MTAIPTLTTERLTLRAPGPQDVAPLAAFYAGPRSGFVGGPLTEWQVWRYLAEAIGHWSMRGYGRWIAETRDTGTPVGLIGLHRPLEWPEPEIGWILFEGAGGRGYATEAALASRDFAYGTLGWTTAISSIETGNTASEAVAARLGAVREGIFRHPTFGPLDLWRHPGPDALKRGDAA